jgi:NADPH:quinone reductase-like Zn-dependent oxidoreductase
MGPLVNRRFPKVPGADLAGEVIAVGPGVDDIRVGDSVFGAADPFKGGAFAERIALPAKNLCALPAPLALDVAACLPIAGLAALQSLRDLGLLQTGQSVLIHGATGPVGLMAVQLAKRTGAEVVAVGSAGLETARRLGADRTIDYRREPDLPAGERFDVVLNLSGKLPFARGRRLLKPQGRLVEPSPTIPLFIGSKLGNLFRRQKHMALAAAVRRADLALLADLAVSGSLEIVIAAQFPFSAARDAYAMVERGGVIGKVVVTG